MKNWHTENPKRLHQARIGENIKQSVRTLAIISGMSISDITEEALTNYVASKKSTIRDYHKKTIEGLR